MRSYIAAEHSPNTLRHTDAAYLHVILIVQESTALKAV